MTGEILPGQVFQNHTREFFTARETNIRKVLHWLTKRFGVGFRKDRNNGDLALFLLSVERFVTEISHAAKRRLGALVDDPIG